MIAVGAALKNRKEDPCESIQKEAKGRDVYLKVLKRQAAHESFGTPAGQRRIHGVSHAKFLTKYYIVRYNRGMYGGNYFTHNFSSFHRLFQVGPTRQTTAIS